MREEEERVRRKEFFEQGYWLSAIEYFDTLETELVPWMNEITGPEPFFFQQDGAPAHTAYIVQKYSKSKSEWPPYSPDLNRLDYPLFLGSSCAKGGPTRK